MIQGSLVKMDGMEAAKGFYGMSPQNNQLIGLFVHGYYFVISAGAIPSRLFLRKNLGERSFSPFAFLLSVLFYFYYGCIPFNADLPLLAITGYGGIFVAQKEITDAGGVFNWYFIVLLSGILNPYLWFVIWLVRRGITHFKAISKKTQENKIQYSYYRGDGKYFEHRIGDKKWGFDIDEMFLRMVIEPLAVFRFGVIVLLGALLISSGVYFWGVAKNHELAYAFAYLGWLLNLGLIIIFSSICLFLEEFGIMTRIRGAALDLIDGEYDLAFVMKKKEELEKGKESVSPSEDFNLAEQIYQSDPIKMDTIVTMANPNAMPAAIQSLESPKTKYKDEATTADLKVQTLREKLREQFLKNEE